MLGTFRNFSSQLSQSLACVWHKAICLCQRMRQTMKIALRPSSSLVMPHVSSLRDHLTALTFAFILDILALIDHSRPCTDARQALHFPPVWRCHESSTFISRKRKIELPSPFLMKCNRQRPATSKRESLTRSSRPTARAIFSPLQTIPRTQCIPKDKSYRWKSGLLM